MKREDFPALLHVLTWTLVIGVSLLAESRPPIPRRVMKPLGELIFLIGMAEFTWASAHLKGAFLGNVEPVLNTLVKSGPYRWVRHPLYLGMIISTLGLVIGLGSVWGIIGVFLLFVPAVAYRAKREEKALARMFGSEWDEYARQTDFLLPALW